jgi:hypothetical protein
MMRACSNCEANIKFIDYYKQFIRNRYKYICKDCGTVYSVTGFSILLNLIIMLIPMSYMTIKRLLVPNIIWILIWGFVLQPFILLYKQNDINNDY